MNTEPGKNKSALDQAKDRFRYSTVRPLTLICTLFVIICVGIMMINSVRDDTERLRVRVTDLSISREEMARERDKLQSMIERYSENTKRSPNLYEGFIRSVFMRSLLEQQMALEDAAEGAQTAVSGGELLFREISNFKEEEIPRAYQMIDQITRQINGSVAARKRAAGRSDRLDFKKTIRAGLSAGGSLAHLHYKRRRRSPRGR